MKQYKTPYDVRLACRNNTLEILPKNAIPGYLCVNMVMFDKAYADDFKEFCHRNPKPCPLLGIVEAGEVGCPSLGKDIDVRTDLGSYDIYRDGKMVKKVTEVKDLYKKHMTGFFVGSSVSFDGLLIQKGMTPSFGPKIQQTTLDCEPVGPFKSTIAVTIRSFEPSIAEKVWEYTSHFPKCHGAPMGKNNAEELGITQKFEEIPNDHDCLYWACGVTPSYAAANAGIPLIISYTPGWAMITDIKTESLYE